MECGSLKFHNIIFRQISNGNEGNLKAKHSTGPKPCDAFFFFLGGGGGGFRIRGLEPL